MNETGYNVNLDEDSPESLNKALRQFYGVVRNKDGSEYNHNTMRSIRSSMNRHIQAIPRSIDIIQDKEFVTSNTVFDGQLKKNKAEGKDQTQHKTPITDKDWKTLHDSDALSTKAPTTLQNKVLTNLLTHFGRRGNEGLRQMTKKTFVQRKDENGKKYYEMAYNELTKNYQNSTGKSKDISKGKAVMVEQANDPRCPVASFEMYLGLLHPNCDILFPYPLDHVNYAKRYTWKGENTWYSKDPLGKNMLASKMKKISKDAGLSKAYTNHCVRSTVITRLSRMGVEARKIINVTGHKHPGSVQHYCGEPTIDEKSDLSTMLHDAGPAKKKLKLEEAAFGAPIIAAEETPALAPPAVAAPAVVAPAVAAPAVIPHTVTAPAVVPPALAVDEPAAPAYHVQEATLAIGLQARQVTTQAQQVANLPGNFANIFTGAVFNNATINFNFGSNN